jgi:hypothetical protein
MTRLMSLRAALRKALTLPPHVTAGKAWARLAKVFRERSERRERERLLRLPSYEMGPLDAGALLPLVLRPDATLLGAHAAAVRDGCERTIAHEFDLLGSGLVKAVHGFAAAGFGGRRDPPGPAAEADPAGDWLRTRTNGPNCDEARRRWALIRGAYAPLNWHTDFRSGFQWGPTHPSRSLSYGRDRGADVKVPWELGRMLHLPRLAYGYVLASASTAGFRPASDYASEFRNQVLDFSAQNPPGWGVQWACTMDAAIRAANLAAAYGLFRTAGAVFDPDFEEVLHRCLREHRDQVLRHIEWDPDVRANHYLANVAGLLLAAATLPPGRVTDAALAFATQEVASETMLQFHPDGSNFEASTSYHRLSAETVLFATATVLGLPAEKARSLTTYEARRVRAGGGLRPAPMRLHRVPGDGGASPFGEEHFRRLAGMRTFVRRFSHPDAHMPQFGDNDGGRFLVLEPDAAEALDHRSLVSALGGIVGGAGGAGDGAEGAPRVEEAIVRGLAGGRCADVTPPSGTGGGMGLHLLANARIHGVVRCGEAGQAGYGGHAHVDLLSIELSVGGARVVVDPGTYVYTPLPDERNVFRSAAVHNAFLPVGREPVAWKPGPEGLFSVRGWPSFFVERPHAGKLIVAHEGFGARAERVLELSDGRLAGTDSLDLDGPKSLRFLFHPSIHVREGRRDGEWRLTHPLGEVRFLSPVRGWSAARGLYSPSYGRVQETRALLLRTEARQAEWAFEAG